MVITTWPFTENCIGALGETLNIYYRIDDFSAFPGVRRNAILSLEKKMINKVDMMIASAVKLTEDLNGSGKIIKYIPHGVDYEQFASNGEKREKLKIQSIRGPRIGSYGSINSWIDFDFIEKVAKNHAEWSFVFIGPSQLSIAELARGSNVHYLGNVPYEALPAHASCFDVALILFKANALTISVNPLKLMEYFGMGLPVVSTALPEVLKYKDALKVADSANAFGEAIRASLAERAEPGNAVRRNLAKENGWEEKSAYLRSLIEEALDQRASS